MIKKKISFSKRKFIKLLPLWSLIFILKNPFSKKKNKNKVYWVLSKNDY